MRVLLAEDHPAIAESIAAILRREKYAAVVARDGKAALALLRDEPFDLAIIDIGLPLIDGFAVCESIRRARLELPILMLTARESVEDRVRGLDCGADDYLLKPFHVDELCARLRTLARRGTRPILERVICRDVEIDRSGRRVLYKNSPIPLAATEYRIVELLTRHTGITLKREQLLDRIWGTAFEGDPNIIDVYISAIRRKFKHAGAPFALATVRGLGYRFDG